MSEADDVRWLAKKIVAKAFHSVSDEAVEAMARRVLELEPIADAEAKRLLRMARERNTWMDRAERAEAALAEAVAAEREACAQRAQNSTWCTGDEIARQIRARGAR